MYISGSMFSDYEIFRKEAFEWKKVDRGVLIYKIPENIFHSFIF